MSIPIAFNRQFFTLLLAGSIALISCSKKKFLDKKPSSDLFVPTTLNDFQALLDNDNVMSETPMMGELSADNYYIPDFLYNTLKTREVTCYTWEDNIYIFNERTIDDWNKPYQQVFYANEVLQGVDKIDETTANRNQRNLVLGSALFIRSYAFHNLVQVFSPAWDPNISAEDNRFGIPLRLSPEFQESKRNTVTESYDQIIKDLNWAIRHLPSVVDTNHLNRPSKPAAYALMARVYLSMRQYEKALDYADSCLDLYNSIIDYSTLNLAQSNPFPFRRKNVEALYQSRVLTTTNILKSLSYPTYVDSNLYASYSTNDLRKSAFYNGSGIIRSGYNGSIYIFTGLATDEMYCIMAECLAREGNVTEAMNVLNQLLEKRYIPGTFTPLTAANPTAALDTILQERRKELSFRGLRWSDLRRFNKEGRNIIPKRFVNGSLKELPVNSRKYVLPVPKDVISHTGFEEYRRN
jgi:starch-binding outer membrane protein, SusD/RagB family